MTNLVPQLNPRHSQRRPLVLFVALMAIVALVCLLSLALASLGRRGEAAPERLRAGLGPDRMSPAEFATLLRAYEALAVDLLGPTPTP